MFLVIIQVLWCSYVFTVTYLLLLFFFHLSLCYCKGSIARQSLVFAARQIANNLLPIV